jgi:hypothetical protein
MTIYVAHHYGEAEFGANMSDSDTEHSDDGQLQRRDDVGKDLRPKL